jgi:hypothetical protein
MTRGTGIVGSSVVVMFGAARKSGVHLIPANDNGTRKSVNTVTVRKQLDQSGVTIKIKVPVEEYVGVAVATHISEEGELSSSIELVHDDHDLNYRVFKEIGNTNVVAEWQNWGRKLRLPLFIRSGDGSLMPYTQRVSGIVLGDEQSRRKLSAAANRRPRFLNRRTPGGETA